MSIVKTAKHEALELLAKIEMGNFSSRDEHRNALIRLDELTIARAEQQGVVIRMSDNSFIHQNIDACLRLPYTGNDIVIERRQNDYFVGVMDSINDGARWTASGVIRLAHYYVWVWWSEQEDEP